MAAPKTTSYKRVLQDRLALYGHRNWIVIADSAYPAQSNPGIETIATGSSQLQVVKDVLFAVQRARHVRGIVHLDAELDSVAEQDACGVDSYRKSLSKLLAASDVRRLPHEQIIRDLDAAAKLFAVLILKTTLTIPYTSVFVQLDCGYWTADAEARLRRSFK